MSDMVIKRDLTLVGFCWNPNCRPSLLIDALSQRSKAGSYSFG